MDFATAWKLAEVGTPIALTDAVPEPPQDDPAWRVWRRANFSGVVVEKSEGELVVQLPASSEGRPVFRVRSDFAGSLDFPNASLALTEGMALAQSDAEAEAAEAALPMRQRLAVHMIYSELLRYRQLSNSNNIPTTLAGQSRQFPTLAALSRLSGNTLEACATMMEDRVVPRVQHLAEIEAQRILAHDAVRAADTRAAKLAAATLQGGG